ncbi:hypothetical protein A2456_01030 [Candidatus Nomurabacteria bacterium RIFOXYC2_FULL_36_19]|uniref:Uncharacterized protein n=3 Tax=Candidatus Nomuraibacteriota TaxID=1752729 RepID=A0A1F6YRB0_9BACT|nr:MAG: hypothetical protein A2238_00420 [Candidatus Nomurabacteria bacterium RIFOXYA2_FULL_35_9]OGJ05572.1 MAG: hypothetical protein A2192_02385 [Candidatus Nomurabacteria bacterium RIFOXYA1_FULL_35_17]OGJ08903.1 MAG: hypothetical protein A2456_01030 [Candidatus Nomurabacteria bacterium RIFOXYC2_FULL_36_19]OGJ14464.1 MAG: hypothetical protein A2554_01340 [Candidatus Nomurabacteria bacterium RIFOXYD2_FULL_35_12]
MLAMNKDMNKNLKDYGKDIVKDNFSVPASCEVKSFYSGSYTKTHKLITALYMVTDIMDKDEPIRNKLRILGTEIISDPEGPRQGGAYGAGMSIIRIEQILALLSIASTMNFVSEMNCAVLKKEFVELKDSIQEHVDVKPTWISEFLASPVLEEIDFPKKHSPLFQNMGKYSKGHNEDDKGQHSRTRIGVQKGSTLLKALSDKTSLLSQDFDILKKQRRDNIINIIKTSGGNATIKDIKIKIDAGVNGGVSFSEKTLQRELLSLIKDGVLNKTGEKRWSRYFIK